MNQEDHDLLIRVETKLDKALMELSDIDTRVETLEKGYWRVVGGAAVIVVVADVFLRFIVK